jgi:transposase
MKDFELSPKEITVLRAAHKKERLNVNKAYRINAVILLGSGWTLKQVSEALLLDEDTLSNYVTKYKEGGFSNLLKTLYQGSNPLLNEAQLLKLCEELDRTTHLTTLSIRAFIEGTFGVTYSQSGVTNLLKQLGFTYKKPKLVPASADKQAQEDFLKFYLDFMENKPSDELVFFADGVHAQHNSLPSYGWIRKGEDRELKSNTGRSRFNIHGAMNAETFETTIVSSESNIDRESTITLLNQLQILYPFAKKIHVILDNAKYHYSKEVRDFVSNSKINLVYLPAYSPELNLIERLWRVFKKNVLYNKYYEKFDFFKKACLDFFRNQRKYLGQISSIMGDGLESLSIA